MTCLSVILCLSLILSFQISWRRKQYNWIIKSQMLKVCLHIKVIVSNIRVVILLMKEEQGVT